ncbi:MAG TPA: glutathione S-transferase family protein [Polyangiaceae bacterium]|nr:glutathione S-transferase family protein [Polyangiaceae bacterium]
MSEDSTPLLTYFDIRGRAEVIRLILEEVGAAYRERRVPEREWAAVKPTMPFGQMPLYQEGELVIPQSHAIYRYLARKYGLYGQDERERVRCDIVEEVFVDAQNVLGGFFWHAKFAELRSDFERTRLPELLAGLERLLAENDGGRSFWVGQSLSYVDFCAWHFLDYVRAFSQAALERFPLLHAFKQRIEARPRIAAYLASERRPRTLTVSMAPFGGTPETS